MVNIYRTRTSFIGGIAGAGVNTLYWGTDTPGGGFTDIQAKLQAFWSGVRNVMAAGITITVEPEIEEVDPATGHLVDVHAMATYTGTGAGEGEPLPWATQALVRFRTGITMGDPAREIRGRMFIPAMNETRSTAGKPAGTLIAILQPSVDALVAADAQATLLVYSKKNFAAVPVTSATVWGDWAQLRSRRD